jgi:RNA polymerase sigma-54 factor
VQLGLSQDLRFKMSPMLYQSLKLMELPIVDLREKIEEEIEKNPALDVLEDKSTVSLDEASVSRKDEDDYFESVSDSGYTSRGGDEAADEQRRFIEGALSRMETLQEHLLWQLHLEPIDDELRLICETLIQNLNEDGFHREPPDLIFKQDSNFPLIPPPRIDEGMRLIQSLDPVGTCTADYHESLRVQVRLLPDAPPGLEPALDYLELLERGKIAETAKKLKVTEDEVKVFFERIKELSPFPGRRFAASDVRYVVPDVRVVKEEEDFVIVINDEEIPVLGINPFFMKLSDEKDGEKKARDFVKENIKEARWFIQSINRRNHTLVRVSRAIVEFQRSFFVNGPKYLAPLTLGDIAVELGLDESTVSRTANGKYMQTEWGIFEIRHFFTNSISGAGSGGSRYSKEGVKEIIRELIVSEDRHFSDQEITKLLSQRGIPLARRTVAKYRNELDLGSSYTR